MVILVALDPGIRGCGVSIFSDGKLYACAYVKSTAKKGNRVAECVAMAGAVHGWVAEEISEPRGAVDAVFLDGLEISTLVAEWPKIYFGRGKTKGQDANDLPPLTGVDCAVAALLKPVEMKSVEPSEWKRQMPTEGVVEGRVAARLDAAEKKIYEAACAKAKSLSHNVTDSVGIALHHLGRFEPQRVFHK